MKHLVSILLFFVFQCANAQSDSLMKKIGELKGDIVGFAVDNLDNIYTLNSRNQLRKYNANLDSAGIYNDVKQYGVATLVDVTNPLKILLYYQDYSTVVELDRFLNPVNVLDLRRLNIFRAKAIGQSYDNAVWVFDEVEHQLKKVSSQGKVDLATPDLRLVLGKAISPVRIFDENRLVYIYDPAHGVYVFDYFGTLQNNILLQNWENLTVSGKYIFGSKDSTILRYEIRTFRFDEWNKPQELKNSVAFRFSSSRLFALTRDENDLATIHIFSIQ